MRDYILLFVNGIEHRVKGTDVFLTLSDFVRSRLGLCGTKIVCSEGDCGSCSVLCGTVCDSKFNYLAIDSCIRFVFQLDGCHIITVEGIGGPAEDKLNSIQKAMIDCHGSQCGFCTPGFVVAMTGILENEDSPSEETWRRGLSGNLCRCTGYSPIVAAGKQAASESCPKISERFDDATLLKNSEKAATESVRVEFNDQSVFCPTSLDETLKFLGENPDSKIVAGGTDVGVQFNKGRCEANHWLDLNRVTKLSKVHVDSEAVVAGSTATWTDVEEVCSELFPQFQKVISIFGSPQIRNVGTIGGNIINASPIADSLPFLFVCDATVELRSSSESRSVNINDFYHDYKQFDLKPGELLTQIRIPLIPAARKLDLYKVSRRLDMDISTFTAAVWVDLEGETISGSGIAMGAVGPTVLRLKKTELFLRNKPFTEETMKEAGELAVEEITPISDVRGGADYRLQLARNVLVKFFHQSQQGVLA